MRRFLIFFAFISVAFLAPGIMMAADSSSTDADREQQTAQQVSYIVSGIVSYSRWPDDIAPSKACIVGSTLYMQALFDQDVNRNSYAWQHYQDSDYGEVERCDIVYIGSLTSSEQHNLLSEITGKPVLSISEHDPECYGGSLICLNLVEEGSSFQVNLDAVARSGIRIHPQVLKLGRE